MEFNSTTTTATTALPRTIILDYAQAVLDADQWLRVVRSQILIHPSVVSFIFISGIVIFVIYSTVTRHLRLGAFIGPRWAAYSRLWLCKTIASGESAARFVEVNQKYGSVARIGPNHLLTDDPEFIRKILAARSRYTRGPWFDSIRIDPEVPNIVSERHPGRHNHLRHQMSKAYAGRDIEGLEDMIDERIQDFIWRIEQSWLSSASETKIFDIARRVQFLAVDTITQLCFGKPMGFVKTDSDVSNFLATIKSQLPIVQHFSVIIEINSLLRWMVGLPFMKRFIVPSSRDKSGIGVIMGVCNERPIGSWSPVLQASC